MSRKKPTGTARCLHKLGYKIGQLEIFKLRQYSKEQLGDKSTSKPSLTTYSKDGDLVVSGKSIYIDEMITTCGSTLE
jgi:hypothetical protein